MTPGIAQALGTLALYALLDLAYKRAASAGIASRHLLTVQAWCYAPAITLYGLATGTLVPFTPAFLWGMAAGLLTWIALYHFARSLAMGALSTIAPVFRLSFVFTAALAMWLLGEPVTGWKLAGLGAALAAVWLLLFEPAVHGSARRPLSLRVWLRILLATAAMAVVNLCYKLGMLAGGSPATVLVGQASVFLPLATGFAWYTDRRIAPPPAAWRHGPVTATLLFFATLLLLSGLAVGEASLLIPVAQMSFVATALFGIAALREPLPARKLAGLASAVAALACLAVG